MFFGGIREISGLKTSRIVELFAFENYNLIFLPLLLPVYMIFLKSVSIAKKK